jgi:hypothetical protein
VFLAEGGGCTPVSEPMPLRAHPHPLELTRADFTGMPRATRRPSRAPARAKAPTSLEERLSALAELAEGLGRSSG